VSDTLSGFLLLSEPEALRSAFGGVKRLGPEYDNVNGWRYHEYVVDESIPQVDVDGSAPYTHRLVVRRGFGRLILVSSNYHVCEHFIERDLRPLLPSYPRRADIGVHDLVKRMTEYWTAGANSTTGLLGGFAGLPKDVDASEWDSFNQMYVLGYASSRTDAFSGSLQKMDFQGENLPSSSFFVEAVPLTRFRSCGLRTSSPSDQGFGGGYELLRIGKSGFVSFSVPQSPRERLTRFKDIERLLKTLSKFGIIK